jgi:putative transposase
MANSYTQIHMHLVFIVQNRDCVIKKLWKDRLYGYITGIVQANGHKLLAINGMPDHIHVLIGMRPKQSVSDLVQDIKGGSSKWINEEKLVMGRFAWQEGYGAFSYCRSHLETVIRYIMNQEEHHRKRTFIEEYTALLHDYDVPYDDRYLFHSVDYLPDDN